MIKKITLKNRACLLALIASLFDEISLSVLRDLHDELGISDHEVDEMGLVNVGETFEWENDNGKEVYIPEHIMILIIGELLCRDKNEELPPEWIGIYEIFVGENETS